MKKSIIIIVSLFFFSYVSAQVDINIPELKIEKKYKNIIFQIDAIATVSISYAKDKGTSAVEFGKYVGEKFKYSWGEDISFQDFANGCIYNLLCFIPETKAEIITNSEGVVKIKTELIGIYVKKKEPVYGVTYKEYMDFLEGAMNTIGEHFGYSYKVEIDKESMNTIISKKKN